MSHRKLQEQAIGLSNLSIRQELDLLTLHLTKKEFQDANRQIGVIKNKLTELHNIDPENENIIDGLKYARLNLRRNIYVKILIFGLLVAVLGLILSFVESDLHNYLFNLGIGITLIIYMVQLIDWKLIQKTQT